MSFDKSFKSNHEIQGENPCHVLLVLLGLMSAPHCTHVRAALVSIKESS